jgi:hypothetical protein
MNSRKPNPSLAADREIYSGPEILDTLQYEWTAEAARRVDSSLSARRRIEC